MSFIITGGFGGDKLVTVGYGSASLTSADSSSFYYGSDSKKKRKMVDLELLFLLSRFLEQTQN